MKKFFSQYRAILIVMLAIVVLIAGIPITYFGFLRNEGAEITQGGGNNVINKVNSDPTNYEDEPIYNNSGADNMDKLENTNNSAGSSDNNLPDSGINDDNLIPELVGYPRKSKIVKPKFETDDIIISDFDVTDFGADPTGKADSTKEIQTAIQACFSAGGGTVWMPAGTYKVTDTITVPTFVYLRGDWCDPDTVSSDKGYGTVISAELESGEWGPVLFQVAGSSAVKGLTVYYPNQDIKNVVPYNYTFNLPAYALGPSSYLCSSIINCTMLNSYKGIGISATDASGRVENFEEAHGIALISNVKGTVLYNGLLSMKSSDSSTLENITFKSDYWANAGKEYSAPSKEDIEAYTLANASAFIFGDDEWEIAYNLYCSHYKYGIDIVRGTYFAYSGQLYGVVIDNAKTALRVLHADIRAGFGIQFFNSKFINSTEWDIECYAGVDIKLTNTQIDQNKICGRKDRIYINNNNTNVPEVVNNYVCNKVTREVLYDVTKAPYNAPYTFPQDAMPTKDATAAIQKALDDAGNAGGGVVYIPAGWYRLDGHLTVPKNVELRGSASAPGVDQEGISFGTLLFVYEGRGSAKADTATAFITMTDNCGVSGLRFFYPENNPQYGIASYPFTIRGTGKNMYAVNLGFPGVYNAIDFSGGCDNHYIKRVIGPFYNKGIVIGKSTKGTVQACLSNIQGAYRIGLRQFIDWPDEGDDHSNYSKAQIGDTITRQNEILITLNGAENELLLNNFCYSANTLCWIKSGNALVCNSGMDNMGSTGFVVRLDNGTATAINIMRYNGIATFGDVNAYNISYINYGGASVGDRP